MRLFRRITGTASDEREDLFAEIGRLTDANREQGDPETERRLLRLRHRAGLRMLAGNGARPEHPSPDFERLPEAEVLPELSPGQVTPGLLRAGILRDGCVLVRGLVDRDRAVRFAEEIDRSFHERERLQAGHEPAEGYYEEFEPEPPHVVPPDQRTWIQSGGGVLAVDSPRLAAEMLDMFESAGVTRLVEGYLGERPVLSLEKTTLRKAEPQVSGAWHQDGRFMGDVRALNLWLSLSRCGDESPGLDIVPKRIEDIVTTNTDEATIDIQISQSKAEEAAGDTPIVRPIFEPGDALFFDDLFLHKTGSDPSMPKPRYAIESWFFGASAFPEAYGPVAV
jgi:Phytanoyl-CoA dioxygenase (PhyH)